MATHTQRRQQRKWQEYAQSKIERAISELPKKKCSREWLKGATPRIAWGTSSEDNEIEYQGGKLLEGLLSVPGYYVNVTACQSGCRGTMDDVSLGVRYDRQYDPYCSNGKALKIDSLSDVPHLLHWCSKGIQAVVEDEPGPFSVVVKGVACYLPLQHLDARQLWQSLRLLTAVSRILFVVLKENDQSPECND